MRVACRSHTTWSFFLQLRLFHVALRSAGLKAVQVEIRQTDIQHIFFSCLGLCLVPLTNFNSISNLIHPFMSHWNPFLDSGDIQFFPLSFSLSKEIFHLSPWLWESNENLTCQMCCCCCSCCSVSGVFPPHSRAYPTERSCLGVGNWPKHKWVTPQC